MATTLINIVQFTGLGIGTPVTQATNLNINGTAVEPDLVFASSPGYNVTVTDTSVTVTRPADGGATLSVFVWRIHTTPRVPFVLGGVERPDFPFVLQGGSDPTTALIGFTGASNTALGENAGAAVTTATHGVFIGVDAGGSIIDAVDCTAVGFGALSNGNEEGNTAVGTFALQNCSTGGFQNVGVGAGALQDLTAGFGNTAVGYNSLSSATGQANNCAFGWEAMLSATAAESVAVGAGALAGASGNRNCVMGYSAGSAVTSGNNNVLLGYQAGQNLTVGANNVFIGSEIDSGVGVSGAIAIGKSAAGAAATATVNDGLFFHNALATVTATAVHYNATTGQMGPSVSSLRFKENITDMEQDAAKVLELRPVSFDWKPEHLRGMRTFGLIAEEVVNVYPEAVPRDGNGECLSVNYEQLVVPLIALVKQQQAAIETLTQGLAHLTAQLGGK